MMTMIVVQTLAMKRNPFGHNGVDECATKSRAMQKRKGKERTVECEAHIWICIRSEYYHRSKAAHATWI